MFWENGPWGDVTLHALLYAIAALIGHFVLIWRAGQVGLSPRRAAGFSACLLVGAQVGGHALFLLQNPEYWSWNPFAGSASLGGLLGGALAAGLYLKRYGLGLGYFSAAAWSFPFAWMIGRSGCALGGEPLTEFEVLYSVLLAGLFWRFRDDRWPYAAILLVSYGFVRLSFYTIRVAPPAADLAGACCAIVIGLYCSQRKIAW